MEEILRTNDVVAISSALALLRGAGFEVDLLDQFTANMEGSIGAIPRRVVVRRDDAPAARALLRETGLFDGDLR